MHAFSVHVPALDPVCTAGIARLPRKRGALKITIIISAVKMAAKPAGVSASASLLVRS